MAGPQLLEKRQVNAEVATQKAQSIKQGLDLAKKVDVLRELKMQEEGNLEKFRTETIAQVQREIDAKIDERDGLEQRLVPMRQEYQLLLTPPDLTKDREEVRTKLANLEQDISEVNQKKSELEQGIVLNIQRERENEIETNRIAELKRLALKDREDSDSVLENAKQTSRKMTEESGAILESANQRELEVKNREIQQDAREKILKTREELSAKKEKDLSNRERLLKDRMDTLTRTENRIRK